MNQELRNPPANEVTWAFRHRPTDKWFACNARTAWAAVRQHQLSFQECDNFKQHNVALW